MYILYNVCLYTFQNVVDVYSNLLDENNEPGYVQVIYILVWQQSIYVQHNVKHNIGRWYAESDGTPDIREICHSGSRKSWHEWNSRDCQGQYR